MSATTVFLAVAALLLTGLAATPADAHPVRRFPIPGRYYRWRGWQRRYSPPAATPTTPTPTPPAQQCTCAPSAPTGTGAAGGARSAADVPDPDDCVTPLAGVIACGGFLTGSSSSADAPAPGSECCAGLAGFFDSATVAGGGGDSQLKCLCPVIRGDVNVNELMVKPIDPLKMIFLPSACGVVVPPQVIPLCLNASSRFVTTTPP